MSGTPVILVPDDPEWSAAYQRHARRVQDALGERARRVEHIGSTSVPGLAAKPIIDMLVVVAHPEHEDQYVPYLTAAGYPLHRREPEFHEHRLHKGVGPAAHLHVFGPRSAEVERYLLFRDLLRRDADARAAYEAEKHRLANQHWVSVNDYADAKSPVVERLIALARSTQASGNAGLV